jgi:hypothetical protein
MCRKNKNVQEKTTEAADLQKPDTVLPTPEGMKAPDHAATEASQPEIARIRKLIGKASGIRGERLAERILVQLERMQMWGPKDAESVIDALEMMVEMKPANVLEAMLTVQMVGVHEAALMFLKRATMEGQTFAGSDANALRATRLLRVFNEQLDAMARLKGKAGHQKVTVEHVHVYQGGQAVVGAVNTGKEGPGEGAR